MEQKMINNKVPQMYDLLFPVVGDVVRRMALLGKHRKVVPGLENQSPIASVVEGKRVQAKTPSTTSSIYSNVQESNSKITISKDVSKSPVCSDIGSLDDKSNFNQDIEFRVHKSMPRLKIANNLTIDTSFSYCDDDGESYSSFSIPPYSVLSENEYGEYVKTCNYLHDHITRDHSTTLYTTAYPSDDEDSVCTSSKSIHHIDTGADDSIALMEMDAATIGKTPACSPINNTSLLKKPTHAPMRFSFFYGMFSIRRTAVVPSNTSTGAWFQ